jgi:hypothetical protein
MSDERNVEVYEVEDGHDRYECMSKLLMLLPGDALLPAKGDVILAQAALPDVPRNHHERAVAYRVVEREFFYREDSTADPAEQRPLRSPVTWIFVRRIPEDDYTCFSKRT